MRAASLALTGFVAIPALACAQVVGANDYSVAGAAGSSGDATGEAIGSTVLPMLPTLPDSDFVESCEQCVATECAPQREACLESERCMASLECAGRCSDPDCLFACRDVIGPSTLFEDYYRCVFGNSAQTLCPAACNTGANWECQGEYRWAPSGPESTDIDLRVASGGMRSGAIIAGLNEARYAEVGACEDFLLEGEPTGDQNCERWTAVDTSSTARMTLGRVRRAFAVRGGARDAYRARHYGRPVNRPGWRSIAVPTEVIQNEWLPAAVEAQGVEFDWNAAVVTTEVYDCTGASANGVRREILAAGYDEPLSFTWTGWGSLALGGDAYGYLNVPPDPSAEVRVVDAETNELRASRRVLVAGSWITVVVLYPATL